VNARVILSLGSVVALQTSPAGAQKRPPIRLIGPIVRVSAEPMASISAAVAISQARVFVNDVVAHRVLLFDSTLAKAIVVADSTSATSKAYGARPGGLIAYRGDSALFIDPASNSMPVLSPEGRITRVMAIPQPDRRTAGLGVGFYTPGFDAQGRFIYFSRPFADPPRDPKVTTWIQDSATIVRFDLTARTLDTLTSIKAPKSRATAGRSDDGRIYSLQVMSADVLPLIDDFAVLPNGSLAVVRGRDYHVDWLGTDGKWTATPKMAFDWQHLDDDQKTALIDSGVAAFKAQRDSLAARFASGNLAGGGGGGGRSGRSGVDAGGVGGIRPTPPPVPDWRPAPSDLADYRPPFGQGGVRADPEGNLWIRTTTMVKNQPVYDVVNHSGEIVDRVQLPTFRTIAGFGPGVVYMAVKDSAGVVHLERARVK
jgi:hypothetical protein